MKFAIDKRFPKCKIVRKNEVIKGEKIWWIHSIGSFRAYYERKCKHPISFDYNFIVFQLGLIHDNFIHGNANSELHLITTMVFQLLINSDNVTYEIFFTSLSDTTVSWLTHRNAVATQHINITLLDLSPSPNMQWA